VCCETRECQSNHNEPGHSFAERSARQSPAVYPSVWPIGLADSWNRELLLVRGHALASFGAGLTNGGDTRVWPVTGASSGFGRAAEAQPLGHRNEVPKIEALSHVAMLSVRSIALC
jgi:hypothetical protein